MRVQMKRRRSFEHSIVLVKPRLVLQRARLMKSQSESSVKGAQWSNKSVAVRAGPNVVLSAFNRRSARGPPLYIKMESDRFCRLRGSASLFTFFEKERDSRLSAERVGVWAARRENAPGSPRCVGPVARASSGWISSTVKLWLCTLYNLSLR